MMRVARREAIALALAGAAGAAVARPAAKPATFVLVHGTWLGGWIWADVADRLRAAGHRVFTPTLTGVGERAHLISPAIGLDTHIQDIVAVIDCEEIDRAILVAHSFSGVAATGAADARRDRIAHIAFFDALIPHAGRMTAVETNPDGSETDKFRARRAAFGDGYKMDFFADYPVKMLIGDDRPDLQAKMRRRLTPHPAKTWTDRLVLRNGGWEGLPRTCFRGAGQAFAPSSEKMWGPATGPGWSLVDLPCGRMGMMTDPDLVAAAFARLA
jgi:pimeloyl-ACP methyl ester carboxylesterase